MTTARLDIIDRSVENAHVWINGTAEELGTGDSPQAYRVLRTFLHAVRDHFSVDEAAQRSLCAACSSRAGIQAGHRACTLPG